MKEGGLDRRQFLKALAGAGAFAAGVTESQALSSTDTSKLPETNKVLRDAIEERGRILQRIEQLKKDKNFDRDEMRRLGYELSEQEKRIKTITNPDWKKIEKLRRRR